MGTALTGSIAAAVKLLIKQELLTAGYRAVKSLAISDSSKHSPNDSKVFFPGGSFLWLPALRHFPREIMETFFVRPKSERVGLSTWFPLGTKSVRFLPGTSRNLLAPPVAFGVSFSISPRRRMASTSFFGYLRVNLREG
jgi:hypothetical protein